MVLCLEVMGSYDNGFHGFPIRYLENPCTSSLSNYCAGLSMKSVVGHSLVNTRLNYNMNFLADFKALN